MYRSILGIAAVAVLGACSGDDGSNPLTGGEAVLDDDLQLTAAGDPNVDPASRFLFDFDAGLTMNELVFDEANNQLIINNLPFDGPDGAYQETAVLANGYSAYESTQTAETGQRQYFAVFRQSDSGSSQAGAAGTGDYQGFGFGGALAERLNPSVSLPGEGEFVYTGDYAAVRILGDQGMGEDDVTLVTGDALIEVDILDFDNTGAVEGAITNRVVLDNSGAPTGEVLPAVILATAGIDFETATINSSTANSLDVDGTELQSGSWEGVFAGPDGEEIAGFILLEGDTAAEDPSNTVRETGTFIVLD